MFLFAMISIAFPCAGLLHSSDLMVESDVQQVIFSLDGDNTVVEYLIRYQGDATEFGWVIPTFGAFQSIEERDGSRFAELEDLTAPRVVEVAAPTSSCGPVATSKGGSFSASDAENDFVQGYTGSFEYVVVPASESDAFDAWANENGWDTGSIDSILPQYASESSIELVLLRLRQDLTGSEYAESPSLKIIYNRHEMRYPAMLAKTSPLPELKTIVYVEGQKTAQIGGWATEEVGELQGTLYEDDADFLFQERLREISTSRASFGLVYAGEDAAGRWITRFDAIVEPSQNTHEPFFSFSDDMEPKETTITLSENQSAWIWGLGFLTLLGLGRKKLF